MINCLLPQLLLALFDFFYGFLVLEPFEDMVVPPKSFLIALFYGHLFMRVDAALKIIISHPILH